MPRRHLDALPPSGQGGAAKQLRGEATGAGLAGEWGPARRTRRTTEAGRTRAEGGSRGKGGGGVPELKEERAPRRGSYPSCWLAPGAFLANY
jgi:hypothetical protein